MDGLDLLILGISTLAGYEIGKDTDDELLGLLTGHLIGLGIVGIRNSKN
jgi:hypothetical protein